MITPHIPQVSVQDAEVHSDHIPPITKQFVQEGISSTVGLEIGPHNICFDITVAFPIQHEFLGNTQGGKPQISVFLDNPLHGHVSIVKHVLSNVLSPHCPQLSLHGTVSFHSLHIPSYLHDCISVASPIHEELVVKHFLLLLIIPQLPQVVPKNVYNKNKYSYHYMNSNFPIYSIFHY